MLKKIVLTEDHIKLIPMFFIQEFNDNEIGVTREQLFSLGNHLLEDMAIILGLTDKAIPNTKNDADGTAYDDETEQYMLDIFNYISENLFYIESLIHQTVCFGGLTPGTYKCKIEDLIWEKE